MTTLEPILLEALMKAITGVIGKLSEGNPDIRRVRENADLALAVHEAGQAATKEILDRVVTHAALSKEVEHA